MDTLRATWQTLIENYEWDHWATLEILPSWHPRDSIMVFRLLQAFIDAITRETRAPVPWLAVVERLTDDTLHLHVFLRGTASIPLAQLITSWDERNGSAVVRPYEPAGNAAAYSVKHITTDRTALLMSDDFDRAMRQLDRLSVVRNSKSGIDTELVRGRVGFANLMRRILRHR